MVQFQVIDYILMYFKFITPLFVKENCFEQGVGINMTSTSSDEDCNSTARLKCEITSSNKTDCYNINDFEFIWYLNSSDSIMKRGVGTNFQIIDVNIKDSTICCQVNSKQQNYTIGKDCANFGIIGNETDANTENLFIVSSSSPPPPQPVLNIHAGLVQCTSVMIMWKVSENATTSLEHMLQYKLSKLDWKSATNISIIGSQDVILVEGLRPWSKYHFRVTSIYTSGETLASSTIVVATREDVPSGPVENVTVSVVDDYTLSIRWKPPPRTSWNGALLGYNIGYKKVVATTSDNENEDLRGSGDSYSFIVLTSMELLGRICEHKISVPDSRILYEIVVQPFNNVGRGPLSIPSHSQLH